MEYSDKVRLRKGKVAGVAVAKEAPKRLDWVSDLEGGDCRR